MRFKQANPQPIRRKYRLYSPTALVNAYKCVKDEGVSVLRASKLHGVPENTLRDRVLGKIDADNFMMGSQPLFSQLEEAYLVRHFQTMADYGYGYTCQECIDIASDYAISLGKRTKSQTLSFHWLEGFKSRWPEMKKLNPRFLEFVRAKMTKESIVMDYFDNLNVCLSKHNLLDKPHLIFNVDEKGISCDHKPPSVLARSDHCPPAVTSGKSKTVTLIGCGSASGYALPPYFVFPGKRLTPDLLKGCTPGASASMSETGWSNSAIFRDFLENHFVKYIPGRSDEKVLLILDGHRSHISVGLVDWAKDNNIVLFILPAHTSHILQPLDLSCYGPFQRMYNNACHKLMRETATVITRYNICNVACKVYQQALKAENLQSGFRRAGIYPLDRDIIPRQEFIPADIFCIESDNESDATVEGGIRVEEPSGYDIFAGKDKELKINKTKSAALKPNRRNVSKIVAGREITDSTVFENLTVYENEKPTPAKKKCDTGKKNKTLKSTVKVVKMRKQAEPEPGPSHINLAVSSAESDSSNEDDVNDEEKCCVCGLFTPKEVSGATSLIFTKWAQCDGMVNGRPCLHWTHLCYCTEVRVVRRQEKFFCPHCREE